MGIEKCPFCGQEIEEHAVKCFFCDSQLDERAVGERLETLETQDKRETARKVHSSKAVLIVLAIIVVGVILFNNMPRAKRAPGATNISERSLIHLDAKVTYAGMRLLVFNNDQFDWNNVRLEISSAPTGNDFGLVVPTIAAGQTYAVGIVEFVNRDGIYFNPYTMKLRKLWIRCDRPNKESGSYLAVWN